MCQISYSKNTEYTSKDKLKQFTGTPKWAFIEITSRCSHTCAWCYGGFNEDKSVEMSVKDYKTILQRLREIGVTQITLSGGEPTEHTRFNEILESSSGFILNMVTHGDWHDNNLPTILKRNNVKQVQFNYQGSKFHDSIHGVPGSYARQQEYIKQTKKVGIHVVCSLTLGKYNLKDTESIFKEMDNIGTDRLRIWETTGFGNKFRKNIEAKEIFNEAGKQASMLGYNYVQSYDPLVKGDCGVDCPAICGLFLYINSKCEHIFCGAVPDKHNIPLSNLLNNTAEEILSNSNKFNKLNNRKEPYCMARL